MDIEQLNKSQIVLLCLLVAFVSSIATGIVTVSLMQQAPPEVTQTINRIVERTVERVVPNEAGKGTETVREITTIVSESDYIAKSVEKVVPRLVRIYVGTTSQSTLRGLGVIVGANGVVATDPSLVVDAQEYLAVGYDGVVYELLPQYSAATSTSRSIALMRLSSETNSLPQFSPPVLVPDPRLGSSVFAISGKERPMIESGIVSAVIPPSEAALSLVVTSAASENILFGSPLFSTAGDLVGIHTAEAYRRDRGGFTPVTSGMLSNI